MNVPPSPHRYAPAEVIEGAAPSRLPVVARSLAAGVVVMLLLGGQPLAGWAGRLPVGGMTDALAQWTQDGQDWADAHHLGAVYRGTRQAFRWLEALRF